MAKNERTVADNIRLSVNDTLRKTRAQDKVKYVSKHPENMLRASAAVYRAVTSGGPRPSEDYLKYYAATVEIIAEKRGIKPEENGKFSKNQLQKELSPQEVMQFAAANYLRDSLDAGKDEATARGKIASLIGKAYEGSPEEDAKPAQQAVATVSPYKTDGEIFDLNEEDFQAYLAGVSPVEQARLNDARQSHIQTETEKEQRKKAGEVKDRMRDPDWGEPEDSDKFKIEQGDIIEYLMKDVILAGAAWVGNKVAGGVGIVAYWTASGIYHGAKPQAKKAWDKTKSGAKKGWKKLKDAFCGNKEPQNDDDRHAREVFDDICRIHDENLEAAQNGFNRYNRKDSETDNFKTLQRQLIKHAVVLDTDSIIYPGNSHQSYSTFLGNNASQTPDELRESLLQIQQNFDAYKLAEMQEQPGADKEKVKVWFKTYNDTLADAVKAGKKGDEVDDYVNQNLLTNLSKAGLIIDYYTNANYINAYKEAEKKTLARFEVLPEERKLYYQQEEFKAHYVFYKMLEEHRTNPDSTVFAHDDERIAFLQKASLEADVLFLTAEKQRREGQDVPSRESLIKEAEKLSETAKNATINGQTQPINDTLKATFHPTADETEQKTLIDAAKDITAQEVLDSQFKNLDAQEKELRGQQNQNDECRKKLQERRKKLENTEQRAGSYRADLRTTRIHGQETR